MVSRYVRKKPISPWDSLSYEEHAEAQAFVKRHPDGGNFDEIGEAMGVSGERARQIYERVIGELRIYFGVNVAELQVSVQRLPRLEELEDVESDDDDDNDEQENWAA